MSIKIQRKSLGVFTAVLVAMFTVMASLPIRAEAAQIRYTTAYGGNYQYVNSNVGGGGKARYITLETIGGPSDIIMYGKNGEKVWQEDYAIGLGETRTFYCGPDVYTVKIRKHNGTSLKTCNCNVYW